MIAAAVEVSSLVGEPAGLVGRLRVGDVQALGELYRRYRPAVVRYLSRRMAVCPADVEDVVQETFLRAPEMAGEFEPATTEVGAWLCGRVAHWTMVDFFRNQRFVQHSAVDAAIEAARRSPAESLSVSERESRPLSTRVVTALARLSPAQRRAVQLRYLEGYSNETAAAVAGTSPGSMATQSLAARKRLRTELADLATRPVSWVATIPRNLAVQTALAECGDDVPAALAWLRRQGVAVDESYAYQIRKGVRVPRRSNAKETAVRDALARLGACDAATVQAQLAEQGIEVSKGYINTVRREVGAPVPANKHTVVRAALAELDTTDAAAVQAHLRERGIEVSKSYINQVRRTPAPAAEQAPPGSVTATTSEATSTTATGVDTSASTSDTEPGTRTDLASTRAAAPAGDPTLARRRTARLHELSTGEAIRAAFDAVGGPDVNSAVGWLRDRGVRVSNTRVSQVRKQHLADQTPTELDPAPSAHLAAGLEPAQPARRVVVPEPRGDRTGEPVDESSASNDTGGLVEVGDQAAHAVWQAREAVARLPRPQSVRDVKDAETLEHWQHVAHSDELADNQAAQAGVLDAGRCDVLVVSPR